MFEHGIPYVQREGKTLGGYKGKTFRSIRENRGDISFHHFIQIGEHGFEGVDDVFICFDGFWQSHEIFLLKVGVWLRTLFCPL